MTNLDKIDKKTRNKKMITAIVCECLIDTLMIFIVFFYNSGKTLLQCILQSFLYQMIFAISLYTLVAIVTVVIIVIGTVFHSLNSKNKILIDISSFILGILVLYVMYRYNVFGVTITNVGLSLVFASALRLALIKITDIAAIRFY